MGSADRHSGEVDYFVCMRLILASVVTFITGTLLAQSLGQVSIIDGTNGAPLPFTTIGVNGSHRGTLANEEGVFSLANFQPTDTLGITHVGYLTRSIAVADLPPGTRLGLERTIYQLAEFTVVGDDSAYERLAKVARVLRNLPASTSRAFFSVETQSDSIPVEMIHAYYNAGSKAAGLTSLELKQGRIAIHPKNGRYFINYNTTRAFAVLDILHPQRYFPGSPLEHWTVKPLKRAYTVEVLEWGNGPEAVDHLRAVPRDSTAGGFILDIWLTPGTERARALELSCTSCPKHPFVPLFETGRIDTVNMRLRQTWNPTGPALLDVIQLSYDMVYTGPQQREHFRTSAFLHAFDHGHGFIPTLFTYPPELADYRKLGWLPEDSAFWDRMAPPTTTPRQQRNLAFMRANDLRKRPWHANLDNSTNFFGAHYALWSQGKRVWLRPVNTQLPDSIFSSVSTASPARSASTPTIALVAQLYLDMDTVNGSLVHRSATVLDGFRTYDQGRQYPWTASFYNIWFDLCEIERRAMEKELEQPGLTVEQARAIHAVHTDRLRTTTMDYLNETKNGARCEPLFDRSEQVRSALGIDNIVLLGL